MSISLHIEAASAQELWAALAKLLDAAQGDAGRQTTLAETPMPAIAPAEHLSPTVTPVSPADGPRYDIATLANASRALVTAGRQTELTALLREFGVARLAEVPPHRFGEYALGLRALGVEV